MQIRSLTIVATMVLAGCGDQPGAVPDAIPDTPSDRPPATDATPVGPTADAAPTDPAALAPGQVAGSRAGEGDGRLYTVQVAAFQDEASAREWEDRLSAEGFPAWVSTARVGGRTFHRVRIGVAPTVDSARRVGAAIRDRYPWPVWIAPLTAADRLPPDAIPATRRLIESG